MAARVTLPLLVVALAARAGAETRPPIGGRVVGSLPSAPSTFDPVAARSVADVTLASLLFDGLYRVAPDGRVVPHLAAAPPVLSADGLEARVTLRHGARFSDGRPVRAADASASLRRAMAAPATAWALAAVDRVTHGEGQVVLKLRRPAPELAARLALPQLAVTPLGRAPPPRNPIGSGPFRVKRLAEAARRLELEAFAEHFAGRPYVDALVLRWFEDPDDEPRGYEAGDADLSLRGAVAFAGHSPKYPTADFEGPAAALTYLGFGRAHGALLDDPDLRAAISLAIGRVGLRHVGSGERVVPSSSPLSPDLGGPSPAVADLAAQPERARAALARAAARHPALRGATLELLVDRSRPDDVDVATRVVAALDRVGVAVTYTTLPAPELARRTAAGLCDLFVGELAASSDDPVALVAAAFAAGGDRALTERLVSGVVAPADAVALFAARLPVVPLYHRAVRVHHRKIVRGLGGDVLGRLGLADAYLWAAPLDPVGAAP